MLVSFPIAFFTGSWLFDISGWFFEVTALVESSFWLQIAGVVFACLAAVPGFIDFMYTVPPNSSGKKRAAKHGILNTSVMLLFLAIWFYRQSESAPFLAIIALETAGVILLSIAGWMGGTLVYRNQIGVDHRYADAGKWKEVHFGQNSSPIEVATADELRRDQMKLVHVGDKRIALARTENGYVAFDDRCTHRGASLADGSMICGTVQCPWHGSQFQVTNGEVKAGPAKEPIKCYQVYESSGLVFLQTSEKQARNEAPESAK